MTVVVATRLTRMPSVVGVQQFPSQTTCENTTGECALGETKSNVVVADNVPGNPFLRRKNRTAIPENKPLNVAYLSAGVHTTADDIK